MFYGDIKYTHIHIVISILDSKKHLNGYKTLWLDNNDDITNINFKGSLFITEGQVDKNIPVLDDCYYVLHNCDGAKYSSLPKNNKMILQVYTHDVVNKHNGIKIDDNDLCYYLDDCLFMPWATDLLPFEIEENIEALKNGLIKSENYISLIGCAVSPWDEVKMFCLKNRIHYLHRGGFDKNNVTSEENVKILQKSLIAPAVQSQWQVDNGYIPCRIFKNISYGKIGMTNNKTVYDLFDKKILYDTNINELMNKGLTFENETNEFKNNHLVPLMEDVKINHTYLNRIKLIFWFLNNKINL